MIGRILGLFVIAMGPHRQPLCPSGGQKVQRRGDLLFYEVPEEAGTAGSALGVMRSMRIARPRTHSGIRSPYFAN